MKPEETPLPKQPDALDDHEVDGAAGGAAPPPGPHDPTAGDPLGDGIKPRKVGG